jgi:hypothetical protein
MMSRKSTLQTSVRLELSTTPPLRAARGRDAAYFTRMPGSAPESGEMTNIPGP